MNDKGFRLISLIVTGPEEAAQDTAQPKSEHRQQDISEEELEEISEIRRLACELTEPDLSLYTST
jgi:hypothetical protein